MSILNWTNSLDSPDWMILPVRCSTRLTTRRPRVGRSACLGLVAVSGAVIGAIVGGVTPAAAAPRAASTTRVTFGIEPATAHHADTRPHFDFGVTPGATLTDHVAVLNYSAKPLSLQVYATDAINTSNGGFGLLPAGTKPVGAGAWVTLPKRFATVRVPAQTAKAPGEVIVPFTVKVPDNAMPGDHVGGILASLRTVGKNATGQAVVLNQRVGTRLFIRVAGTLAPKLTLSDLHASYHGTLNPVGRGSVTVSYQVNNTGNVELALSQGVTISGLLGAKSHVGVASVPLLLPGQSLHETAHLSGVWPQFLVRAKVTAQPLAAAGDSDPRLVAVAASTRIWALPWPLIVLVVILLAAVRLAQLARRRRRQPPADTAPAASTERVTA
jgi:hypothetical protein